MKQKISTQLDEVLFRRARLEAMRQGRQINGIIADALSQYLEACGTPGGPGGIVASSWAALAAPPPDVVRIMREEDGFLGA